MELYNSILKLCQQKGISITTMCKAAGVSRGSLGDLKSGKNKSLSAEALAKVADYFCVTVDYLLGKEETKKSPSVSDEDIKFALFGGEGEITDEMYEEVKRFAEFVKAKHGKK